MSALRAGAQTSDWTAAPRPRRGQRRKVAVRPLSGDSWEPVLCSCPGALARAHGSYLLTLFCPTRHPVLTLDSHLLELLTP